MAFVILISRHFAHDSMLTTVDTKAINSSDRIYLNTYHTLIFIY